MAVVRPAPKVEVRRSKRRRRTVSAYRDGDRIVVLVPASLSRKEEAEWVETMVARVQKSERRTPPTDAELMERALVLNDRYLGGLAVPGSVRWVDNQQQRWGSCTPGDRTIRLSVRLQGMPGWVIDYVLVHELAHLIEPGHDAAFWGWVDRYPQAERAKGYLLGWSAAAKARPAAGPGVRRRLSDPISRSNERRARPARRRGSGSASTGHHRTSVDSSLTAGTAPAGATATNRTSRWCTSPGAPQKVTGVLVEVHRHRVEDQPVDARLLGGLAQRRAGQRARRRARSGRRAGTSARPWRAGSAAPARGRRRPRGRRR